MIEILHFVFRDFWTWLGTVILILAISRLTLVRVNTRSINRNNSPEDDHSSVDNYNE